MRLFELNFALAIHIARVSATILLRATSFVVMSYGKGLDFALVSARIAKQKSFSESRKNRGYTLMVADKNRNEC
jgi:hypothetical protein